MTRKIHTFVMNEMSFWKPDKFNNYEKKHETNCFNVGHDLYDGKYIRIC